jgi:hypothetical protein
MPKLKNGSRLQCEPEDYLEAIERELEYQRRKRRELKEYVRALKARLKQARLKARAA